MSFPLRDKIMGGYPRRIEKTFQTRSKSYIFSLRMELPFRFILIFSQCAYSSCSQKKGGFPWEARLDFGVNFSGGGGGSTVEPPFNKHSWDKASLFARRGCYHLGTKEENLMLGLAKPIHWKGVFGWPEYSLGRVLLYNRRPCPILSEIKRNSSSSGATSTPF